MTERKIIHNVAAALFDLDGTLFDSVGLWHDIDDIFLARRGRVPTDEYKRAIAALGSNRVAEFTVEYYALDDTPEQLLAEWQELARDAYAHTISIFGGVREYLGECRESGIKLAAVTSLRRDLAEPALKNNGIDGLFSHIFTSDEIGLSKNSADIYAYAAGALGVAPECCVVFDDVAAAIVAAKRAGMITVAISGAMFDAAECAGSADLIVPDLFAAPELKIDQTGDR